MPWYARTVMLFVFALYWGGLTFYTGIVVRIIHFVLNDPMDGGLITQRVTNYLQLLGFCVLPFMIWNGMAVVRRSKRLGVMLLVLTGILAASLTCLVWVHSELDAVIDSESREVIEREIFTVLHRRYNQTTTVQWISAVIFLPLAVYSWRVLDINQIRSENRTMQ